MRSPEEIIADLRVIEKAKTGDPWPEFLLTDKWDWGTGLSKLCGEAADTLEYLKIFPDALDPE